MLALAVGFQSSEYQKCSLISFQSSSSNLPKPKPCGDIETFCGEDAAKYPVEEINVSICTMFRLQCFRSSSLRHCVQRDSAEYCGLWFIRPTPCKPKNNFF
jgi:hypothetical protein